MPVPFVCFFFNSDMHEILWRKGSGSQRQYIRNTIWLNIKEHTMIIKGRHIIDKWIWYRQDCKWCFYQPAQCSQRLCQDRLTAFTNWCFRPTVFSPPTKSVSDSWRSPHTPPSLSSIRLFSGTCVFLDEVDASLFVLLFFKFHIASLSSAPEWVCLCSVNSCALLPPRIASILHFSWMNCLFHPGSCCE